MKIHLGSRKIFLRLDEKKFIKLCSINLHVAEH